MVWLAEVLRFSVIFIVAVGCWYIYAAYKSNVKKDPELAEMVNKKRIAAGNQPLPVEELCKVMARENILASVVFGMVLVGLKILLDWGLRGVF